MLFDDTTITRFWAKVDKNGPLWKGTPCWLWTGGKTTAGYGETFWNQKVGYTHRLAYQLLIGAIPSGLELDHLCHNPACCNPEHLEAVTHGENIRRGNLRYSRFYGNYNRVKTHCPQGHPYDLFNTYFEPNGHRQCRICNKLRQRK